MKNYLFFLFGIFFMCCNEPTTKNKSSIFEIQFRDITKLSDFKNYEELNETVLDYKDNKSEFALVEIQKNNNRVIVLEKIIETGEPTKNFQILDTIQINHLKESEFTYFNTCSEDGLYDPGLFTIIEETENDFDLENYTNIKKAWKINTKTKKIEPILNVKRIACLNINF